jgi:hypothetical protein
MPFCMDNLIICAILCSGPVVPQIVHQLRISHFEYIETIQSSVISIDTSYRTKDFASFMFMSRSMTNREQERNVISRVIINVEKFHRRDEYPRGLLYGLSIPPCSISGINRGDWLPEPCRTCAPGGVACRVGRVGED